MNLVYRSYIGCNPELHDVPSEDLALGWQLCVVCATGEEPGNVYQFGAFPTVGVAGKGIILSAFTDTDR